MRKTIFQRWLSLMKIYHLIENSIAQKVWMSFYGKSQRIYQINVAFIIESSQQSMFNNLFDYIIILDTESLQSPKKMIKNLIKKSTICFINKRYYSSKDGRRYNKRIRRIS
ncbi:unnamed protein product [Paramecium octaurelia]|uniref:Uncharacterized protein n=1 Tax=Paramecium octaurelia TaxID=43137 RepID=A0A8S1USV2_PAROT|nr:unnamed protein product [Paramecium octaurelia]